MKQYIEKCLAGENLSHEEAASALEFIMNGEATEAQIAGLLVALRAKGETVEELAGFADVMRSKAVRIRAEDDDAIDIVGTGGDGSGTFNISTAASFVAAGAGVTVAKHGNRSVSSQCGSADVLAALGVNVNIAPEHVQSCVNTIGIGFMFAPVFHPAMKAVAKPRRELGVRTIFNMLGPLTNPAGVRRAVIGTYSFPAAEKLAGVLSRNSMKKAMVVHSEDGMDEIALSGATNVFEINGNVAPMQKQIVPEDFQFERRPLADVKGGTKEENADITLGVLKSRTGPFRDIVLMNAATGIYVAGKASSLEQAKDLAQESIDSGRAFSALEKLREFSNCV